MNHSRRWIAAGLTVGLLFGCSLQGEGERCDLQSNNEDCESGLVCTSPLEIEGDVYRCCPPEGEAVSDDRCRPSLGEMPVSTNEGGQAGQSTMVDPGGGGVAGTTAASSGQGGVPVAVECTYSSQCEPGLVCGPNGVCQPECLDDRDCASPEVCDTATGSCVAPSAAAGTSGG